MTKKRTMTLNLTDQEMRVLEELSVKKDLNKTSVMKLALRVLQALDSRVEPGKKLVVEDEMTSEKSELVLL